MLTFVTYNLHSGKDSQGRMNLDAMADALLNARADVIALQEVACCVSTAGNLDEAAMLRDRLGMQLVFVPAIAYNGGDYGIALLSRHPILSARAYHIPDIPQDQRDRWFEHRIILSCDINWLGRPITVLATHLGLGEGERQNGIALLCRLADEAAHPVIIAGDLNTLPDDPLLAPLLARARAHSDAPTFPSLAPAQKIDYILTPPVWQVQQEAPLPPAASDHLPLRKTLCL